MRLKMFIKTILWKLGLEIHRTKSCLSPTSQLITFLRKFTIDIVFDVGANKGQFASTIRQAGYSGDIISFEPLSVAHQELVAASIGDSKWEVYPRCALGDINGEIEINLAGNSLSSSILPMNELHRSAAPNSVYQGKEIVPIKTFDSIAAPYINNLHRLFLKIDTQGFEWQVIDGGRETLPYIQGALIELSLVPLYSGQHLWLEIIDRLEAEGFALWTLQPAFVDPENGQTLQVDAIFFRK
jgi:FkbM family methyltransferase